MFDFAHFFDSKRQKPNKTESQTKIEKENFDGYVTSKLATKSAEFQAIFTRIRTHDKRLTEVNLANLQLEDDDIIALCFVLTTNPYVLALNLSGNRLSIKSTKFITKLPYVTHLNISNNPTMGNQGIQAFLGNCTLRKLDANYCRIEDPNALAQTRLRELNLCNNHIRNPGLAALAKNKAFITLDLSANNFDLTGIRHFNNHPNLQEFTLEFNDLNDETAPIFVSMPKLNKLNLSANRYTSQGAKILAHGLTIETLNISDNNIGNSGAQALAHNTTLKHLNMETNNKMTSACLDAFQSNRTLETISLKGKNMDEHALETMLYTRNSSTVPSL